MIKFLGKIKKEGETIAVSPMQRTEWIGGMDPNQVYEIIIRKVKSRRTLSQNDLMWWTYRKECEILNQGRVFDGAVKPEELYERDIMNLTDGVVLMVVPQAVNTLKNVFRAVKKIKTIYRKGKEYVVCQCWPGSSTWDKKQMAEFLEYRFKRLYEYGYDPEVDAYKSYLRGGEDE